MKFRIFTLLSLITACTAMQAQTIVSTEPMNRNVVLEEFTGIHCQYCPDGHRIAQGIADANPGRVTLINVHQGSFAVQTVVNRISAHPSVMRLLHKPALQVILQVR
jgi:hypothetical protein